MYIKSVALEQKELVFIKILLRGSINCLLRGSIKGVALEQKELVFIKRVY